MSIKEVFNSVIEDYNPNESKNMAYLVFIVSLLGFILPVVLLTIIPGINPDIQSSYIPDIVIASVAITSLYVAIEEFIFKRRDEIDIYQEISTQPSEGARVLVTNIGNTISIIRVIWYVYALKLDDEIWIHKEKITRKDPLPPGEHKWIDINEDLQEWVFFHTYRIDYQNSMGKTKSKHSENNIQLRDIGLSEQKKKTLERICESFANEIGPEKGVYVKTISISDLNDDWKTIVDEMNR